MTDANDGEVVDSIEVAGNLDRRAAEALRLEILELARRYGVRIQEIRIDREADDTPLT